MLAYCGLEILFASIFLFGLYAYILNDVALLLTFFSQNKNSMDQIFR